MVLRGKKHSAHIGLPGLTAVVQLARDRDPLAVDPPCEFGARF